MNDGKSESVLMQSEKKKKYELCVSYGYICDWLVAFHRVRNLQFPILPIFTNSFFRIDGAKWIQERPNFSVLILIRWLFFMDQIIYM